MPFLALRMTTGCHQIVEGGFTNLCYLPMPAGLIVSAKAASANLSVMNSGDKKEGMTFEQHSSGANQSSAAFAD